MSLNEHFQSRKGILRYQQKTTCPTSASEAYSLGITAKEAAFQTYILLIEHCNDTSIKKTLKTMANLEKREIILFSSWMNFELNCTCSAFYESNGQALPSQLNEIECVHLTPQVNCFLDVFYKKIDQLKQSVLTLGGDDLTKHRRIKDAEVTFAASLQARQICQQLFEDMAALYVDEEIRNAFQNMVEILEKNNENLKNDYTKRVVL
ncbi:MAG: hypothetical protein U9N81_02580 [Bacillota bacterium]|nr:hypothetical protein [Bacillota bacterium]